MLDKTNRLLNLLQDCSLTFEQKALKIFAFQYQEVSIYQQYVDLFYGKNYYPSSILDIPYLPIQFFKTHQVICEAFQNNFEMVFESSTTTGQIPSKHYIARPKLYLDNCLKGFHHFFGNIKQYCILGLLPSYLERGQSSLVYMVNYFMQQSNHPHNGFYLYDFNALYTIINTLESLKQPTLLFGVTYALLDFADLHPTSLNYVKIIETGGMKGRKVELSKALVHETLKKQFNTTEIYTEYGMTELFSQAYATNQAKLMASDTMKVCIREINDPKQLHLSGRGALNIIDIANIDSCAFIATDDLAQVYDTDTFEILGRMDHAEVRGCSLLSL